MLSLIPSKRGGWIFSLAAARRIAWKRAGDVRAV